MKAADFPLRDYKDRRVQHRRLVPRYHFLGSDDFVYHSAEGATAVVGTVACDWSVDGVYYCRD